DSSRRTIRVVAPARFEPGGPCEWSRLLDSSARDHCRGFFRSNRAPGATRVVGVTRIEQFRPCEWSCFARIEPSGPCEWSFLARIERRRALPWFFSLESSVPDHTSGARRSNRAEETTRVVGPREGTLMLGASPRLLGKPRRCSAHRGGFSKKEN